MFNRWLGVTYMSVTDLEGAIDAPASDVGGVAARQGFKYQDHVAAFFVLTMIDDERLAKLECETADDIVLNWRHGSAECPEYVQVKTTEGDRKWTKDEVTARSTTKKPTSLVEKSLICDKRGPNPLFRIVSRRDVNKALSCLKLERGSRSRNQPAADLGNKLAKQLTTKSPAGNDLIYWAQQALWQVTGDLAALAAMNHKKLSVLAERFGANPTASHVDQIYLDLLRIVDDAATSSRVSEPDRKIISRVTAIDWWTLHLANTEAAQQRTSKPYRAKTEAFFAELHNVSEDALRRAMSSFDARYENKKWRSQLLADHLVDWLPEIALKASDLVSVQHLQLRQKTRDAVKAVKRQRSLSDQQLVGETLLHAVIRQTFGSEPIACKLFYQASTGMRSFGTAHIVHSPNGDELWLGRASIATAANHENVLNTTLTDLEHVLDPDFLKEERETILTLREPLHFLPTSLEAALARNAPIDGVVDALCIPILLAYDSAVLGAGYFDDYRERLIQEVTAAYEALKPRLPAALKPVKVHIFMVPIECVETLTSHFTSLMGAG
jgi:Cap4 dsDNA endonuclease/Cap4 SAVED domain